MRQCHLPPGPLVLRVKLTCVKVAVFGQLLGNGVHLLRSVVATVTVELDAGSDVDHEVGQHGDLLEDLLVFVEHDPHVS